MCRVLWLSWGILFLPDSTKTLGYWEPFWVRKVGQLQKVRFGDCFRTHSGFMRLSYSVILLLLLLLLFCYSVIASGQLMVLPHGARKLYCVERIRTPTKWPLLAPRSITRRNVCNFGRISYALLAWLQDSNRCTQPAAV